MYRFFRRLICALAVPSILANMAVPAIAGPRSPIKHLIVVIGENRSFDNVFATYVPADPNQSVWNLLSEGIVSEAGFEPAKNPNPAAQQHQAVNTATYQISPDQTGTTPYATLPPPSTTLNALPAPPCQLSLFGYLFGFSGPPTCTDIGLDPEDQALLSTGGSYQPLFEPDLGLTPVPDCRYNLASGGTVSPLINNSYPLVNPANLVSYESKNCKPVTALSGIIPGPPPPPDFTTNTGDPVHRFYQMWQQADCSMSQATAANPSGCRHDLVTWVAITEGWGLTGTCSPTIANPSCTPPAAGDLQATYQGGVGMGFYNMSLGDYPIFNSLAQTYTINDNYHQMVMGGTGPNSQSIFTGDVFYYADANGDPSTPASYLIANPNPVQPQSGAPAINNFYQMDGLPAGDPGNTSFGGFTNCSDSTQPGVAPILDYLTSLPYSSFRGGNCADNIYYQINNEYPYYDHLGNVISKGNPEFPAGPEFSIGPQTIPTIGDRLSKRRISWRYYGEGFDQAGSQAPGGTLYCAICNAFQYSKSIMTTKLRNNLVDLNVFYDDVRSNTLPAVSFIKPDELVDSHPGTSTPPLFEAFVKKVIESVQANPKLWSKTAILITFDESGGYYDSGYIQPIDFFGDGPRTVMIAVSPFAKSGYVDHTYSDHASILKFIEWNWRMRPLSKRSRDNLPNPKIESDKPYFPINSPAIGNLTTMFDFRRRR